MAQGGYGTVAAMEVMGKETDRMLKSFVLFCSVFRLYS